jgi:glycerophosphoryl diester phosphodiesterase
MQIRNLISFALILAGFRGAATVEAQVVTPVPQAHAHNDYLHNRPLEDALALGFCSVEADIHLIDGELLVAHDRDKTSPGRTLQSLYLDPLRRRVERSGNGVYGDGQEITLLVDIKSDGATTYRALHEVLSGYRDLLSYVDEEGMHRGAVTVIVSGNRAFDVIRADLPRFVGIDGRLSDLESDMPADLMPLISDHWGRNFKWRGDGDLPAADQEKLIRVLQKAHSNGRRVRFWATPDQKSVWDVLSAAGVDMINTDDLEGLSGFLRSRR